MKQVEGIEIFFKTYRLNVDLHSEMQAARLLQVHGFIFVLKYFRSPL